MGDRGHEYEGTVQVHVGKRCRGKTAVTATPTGYRTGCWSFEARASHGSESSDRDLRGPDQCESRCCGFELPEATAVRCRLFAPIVSATRSLPKGIGIRAPIGVGVFKIGYGIFLYVSHIESEVNNITILDNMVSALRLNKPLILGS